MLIRHREADQFISKGLQGLLFFLFFGTDEGLVHERAYNIFKHFQKSHPDCELIDIEGDHLYQNQHRLFEESQSLGLFAQQKCIIINAGSKSFISSLETCIDEDNFQTPVIIKAGALKPDHQLRRLFERHKNMAAIECYPDSPSELSTLIQSSAKAHHFKLSSDAIDQLVHSLGESRLSTRLELDKLYLFCHGYENINLSHIQDISSDASDPIIDELISAVFTRQYQHAIDHLTRMLMSGHEPHLIISSLLRFTLTILRTKLYMDNGDNAESAKLKASRIMGIFGRPQKIDQFARSWSLNRLIKAISIFSSCIDKIRLDPKLANTYTSRAVLFIAR
jgi:DNA polymerase III subunit delta